jgi:hypothetical protein
VCTYGTAALLQQSAHAPHKQCAPVHAQAIFGHLALGQNEAVNPRSFWRAFRDYDGSPINVREHQDAYEFFTRLQVNPVPYTRCCCCSCRSH